MHVRKQVIIGLLLVLVAGGLLLVLGGNSDFDEISLAEQETGLVMDSRVVDLGDIKLHAVFAGPRDGEPVILIHGFPQFWYMWKYHISALAKAGYRVAAVDMRGYNRSAKPQGRAAYSYENYAADITSLMDSQSWESANIVGHDIGAVVTWQLVFNDAERVKKAIVFSGAHPLAYRDAGTESEVSWYRTFFRIPLLPELFMRVGGMSMVANGLRETSRPDTFPDAQLSVYKAAWSREHAIDSMLGAYRNGGLNLDKMPQDGRPTMPVLYVHGIEDAFVALSTAEASKQYLGEDNVHLHTELSHWLLEEEPELTAFEIIDFLKKPIP